MDKRLLRRVLLASGPALMISFGVAFVLIVVDIFLLTPKGAIGWQDGYGNPTSPNVGVPIYAEPHLLGTPMGFLLVGGFLSALVAFLVADWPPDAKSSATSSSKDSEQLAGDFDR